MINLVVLAISYIQVDKTELVVLRISPPVILRLIIQTGCTKAIVINHVEANNTKLVVLKQKIKELHVNIVVSCILSNYREIYSDC